MRIILLDTVENLGNIGDQVNVKAGYARNYLVTKGKAVPATKQNIECFEAHRSELKTKLEDILDIAKKRASQINNLTQITITSKAGDEGKLFGSIGARHIAQAITASGIKIMKHEIRLPNGALRAIGEYEVHVQVHRDVFAKLNIKVIAK